MLVTVILFCVIPATFPSVSIFKRAHPLCFVHCHWWWQLYSYWNVWLKSTIGLVKSSFACLYLATQDFLNSNSYKVAIIFCKDCHQSGQCSYVHWRQKILLNLTTILGQKAKINVFWTLCTAPLSCHQLKERMLVLKCQLYVLLFCSTWLIQVALKYITGIEVKKQFAFALQQSTHLQPNALVLFHAHGVR